jgi:hypothetical protein
VDEAYTKPRRFWIPWRLACQSTVPSRAWEGGAGGAMSPTALREGWLASRIAIRNVCGRSKTSLGKKPMTR